VENLEVYLIDQSISASFELHAEKMKGLKRERRLVRFGKRGSVLSSRLKR